ALRLGQGVEDAQHGAGLIEEDVSLAVAVRAVAVVHRTAERRIRLGVAVAADRQVVAGEQPGVLLIRSGRAEDVRGAAPERLAGVPSAAPAYLAVAVVPR